MFKIQGKTLTNLPTTTKGLKDIGLTNVLKAVTTRNRAANDYPDITIEFTTALTGGSFAFNGGVLLPDGRVFCIPRDASNGKIYDPMTDTQFTTALTSDTSYAFSGGVLLPDGRVFCVPYNAFGAKIYDPVTDTQFTTTLTGGNFAFFGGVLLPDGRVFCVPTNASNGKILDGTFATAGGLPLDVALSPYLNKF